MDIIHSPDAPLLYRRADFRHARINEVGRGLVHEFVIDLAAFSEEKVTEACIQWSFEYEFLQGDISNLVM
jgi:hypothetical protein